LAGFYAGFLEPLKQGDTARLCMKLHFREMLEPTGLWEEEVTHGIKPMHDALLAVLCRHFGAEQPDDELQSLAVCIAGLGVHMHVGHDVINQLSPQLNRGADALDRWSGRLVMYALAMVEAETRRRAATSAARTQ
jgi:TetR/AcrR family transcriptional regulator, regulator of cefoperazone and chloramphenicol sensitivity